MVVGALKILIGLHFNIPCFGKRVDLLHIKCEEDIMLPMAKKWRCGLSSLFLIRWGLGFDPHRELNYIQKVWVLMEEDFRDLMIKNWTHVDNQKRDSVMM